MGKRRGAGQEAGAGARGRAPPPAAGVEGALSGARDVADAGRGLESAESAVLYGAGAGVLGRVQSVRVSARALLGAGESRAPARRGEGRAGAVARDERAGRAGGARAQSRDAAAREGARGAVSRAHLADTDGSAARAHVSAWTMRGSITGARARIRTRRGWRWWRRGRS